MSADINIDMNSDDDSELASAAGDDSTSGGSGSGIRLPRVHLANAIEVLEGAYTHGRSPSITQVASALNQQLTSGAFRTRMAATAQFGLLTPSRGRVQITELGMRVLDVDQRPAALVEAWMNIPVFKSLFDQFDGNRLPPESGIEAELKHLGVPSKNVALTRRVLMSSAETAGLLNSARDRLVRPTFDASRQKQQGTGSDLDPAPRKFQSADTKPIELDFGDAGRIEILVEIDWLALKPEVFGELRTAVERFKQLAATQCRAEDKPQPADAHVASDDLDFRLQDRH